MKVPQLILTGAITLISTMSFSAVADARPIHEIRGQAAVIRGHSFALREFLKAKCHVVPNLHPAQALARQLACDADAFWDLVRKDCHLPPAVLESRLCAVEQSYQRTNAAVRAASAWAPRHHLHHACHLLERIDHHLCKVRRIASVFRPSQPVHVHRPIWPVEDLQVRPRYESHFRPHVDRHVRPHIEPHVRPHLDPHLDGATRVRRYGYDFGRHGGKVHLRIGGLSLCF